MSDYRYQVVDHNGIQCLHVMIEAYDHSAPVGTVEDGIAHCYIPVDDIAQSSISYRLKEMNIPPIIVPDPIVTQLARIADALEAANKIADEFSGRFAPKDKHNGDLGGFLVKLRETDHEIALHEIGHQTLYMKYKEALSLRDYLIDHSDELERLAKEQEQ